MRHRKRKMIVDKPGVDLDALPFGGHDFDQLPDHEDEDYRYACSHCGCIVTGWALDQGLWPAVVGSHCMALLMGVS